MPLERVSQGFKDISMSFQANPLNDDLIALKNETAIARSIRNIVFTIPGEKFFNPDFGSNVTRSLFENIDEISAITIRDEIQTSIRNYEPRVTNVKVEVDPRPDDNSFEVQVIFDIIGQQFPTQEFSFILEATR